MPDIRTATPDDRKRILALDPFVPQRVIDKLLLTRPEEFLLLFDEREAVGLLHYEIFWDYIPYTHYLHIAECARGRGFAKALLDCWEEKMREENWPLLLSSIPSDDPQQHFWRKMGYRDTGSLTLDLPPHAQAPELFFIKPLSGRKG